MAAASFSEKNHLIPKVSFSVRNAVKSDARAISRIKEYTWKSSLRTTSDNMFTTSQMAKALQNKLIPNTVLLVATLSKGGSSRSNSATSNTASLYTVENVDPVAHGNKGSLSSTASFTDNILGYLAITPYNHKTSSYDRTASLSVITFEEDVLGGKLYRALISTLIDEALAISKERNFRYSTVLTSSTFHKDQETLTTYRDILVEKGFKEVGLFKEVVEKNGLLLDLIHLQRDM